MNHNAPVSLDDLPALLGRLRTARKAKRITQQKAADHLKVSRTTLVAIEQGKRRIRFHELVDLANLYCRSVNELLRPVPISEDFVAQFRAKADIMVKGEHLEAAITMLQELSDDYLEIERVSGAALPQRYPPEIGIQRTSPSEAAESVALSERNRLGLGDGPLLELRKMLENDVGLRIFAIPLPGRVAGVFTYSSLYGACIAINANHPPERQRWTLAHEYAHFLVSRSQSEVTVLGGYKRSPTIERFADAFAENFLVPSAGIKRRFHDIRQTRRGGITPADLLSLADFFQVSFQAMGLRLENLNLIKKHSLDKLLDDGFKVTEARQLLNIPTRPADTEVLPARFRYLAAMSWIQGALTEGQLARLLRVDRTTARRIVAKLPLHAGLGPKQIDSNVSATRLNPASSITHDL